MRVSITYCTARDCPPQATSLAAKIWKEYGVESDLIEGIDGVFDVLAGEELIFSKDQVSRFPEDEEVLERLRK